LRIRSEDRAQQNAGMGSLGMLFYRAGRARKIRGLAFQFLFIRFPPRAVELIVAPHRLRTTSAGEITQKDYKHQENVLAGPKFDHRA